MRPLERLDVNHTSWMDAMDATAGWTDQQWAEHDAKIDAIRAQEEAESVRRAAENRITSMVDLGWPRRAIEAADAADLTKPAIEKVAGWDFRKDNVLVLSGPPGCGKTTAAAHWGVKWGWVRFLRATTFAASSRYDRDSRDEWLNSPGLVLDDLGAEYADAKGNFLVDLDELVDTFYGNRRPLLITTNCTSAEFKQRYGSRVVDRFRECGIWFEIGGASLRKKAP